MGAFETLLLLAGSVAAIAAIGLLAYRGFSVRKIVTPAVQNTSTVLAPAATEATTPILVENRWENIAQPLSGFEEKTQQTPAEIITPSPVPSVPVVVSATVAETIPEAPAPFPEDFSNATKTSVPTDVGAAVNFSSPTEGAVSPVLVITTPKIRRARTTKRRLPTSTSSPGTTASASSPTASTAPLASAPTPRRRRSSRTKSNVATTTESPVPSPTAGINEQ